MSKALIVTLSHVFSVKAAVSSVCWVPRQAQDGTCTAIAHCYSRLLSWGRAGARYHPPHTRCFKLLP